MNFLIDYAMQFVGIPYLFGGDTPMKGFDCSGLVCELMRAAGVVRYDFRTNAQGLYDLFSANGTMGGGAYGAGSLAFFGADAKSVCHVGFCISTDLMLEAGGGREDTTDLEHAIAEHAFVKLRPIRYRKDFLCVIKPSYKPMGLV